MTGRLRIAVADDEPDMQQCFQKMLSHIGHEVVSVAGTGQELVEHCETHHPDLVITDIKIPDMDGIEAAEQLYKKCPLPIILVSAHHDPELIARAESDHILAYLVKPIKKADLVPAITIAVRRFEQFEALRREADDLRQALADRKVIERAKGLIVEKAGINEAESFARLQKLASTTQFAVDAKLHVTDRLHGYSTDCADSDMPASLSALSNIRSIKKDNAATKIWALTRRAL